MPQIIIDHHPVAEDIKVIQEGIINFNVSKIHERSIQTAFYLKDDNGKIVGGISAWLHSNSIYIDILWIDEKFRGKGYGTQLMQAAESEAIKQGCDYSTLDTLAFQAEDFYLKNGYKKFGVVKNFLLGHDRIFLRKKL